jgi:hypothetical protein
LSDIESHIATIGRALWARDGRGSGAGRATVMIGSGFSKNAVPETGHPRPFPTWKDLAAHLIDEILPGCDGCTCLNLKADVSKPGCVVLRARRQELFRDASGTSGLMELGQKLEAMKGPALLHGTLRQVVPDLEYGPGKPHQDLVRLPWSDILTTNWDTLLEQAIDAYDRSYELVVQPKQLATATAPRIIKLHGCVRAGTKLIFTEEDFRVYPTEYAPFVSLVQQSLMENVFVLIGFSGSDPNFKAWHGRVRDNLGKYLQPVYLVTNKSADSINVNLFSNRLITVVDLSLLDGVTGKTADYPALLEKFFRRLRDYRFEVRENLNWPRPPSGSDEKSYADMLANWRTRLDRRTKWVIPPTANRLELLRRLDDALELADSTPPPGPHSSQATAGVTAGAWPLLPAPALKALFEDYSLQQPLDQIEGTEFQASDREEAAVLVAETLQIGLAAPREKLLQQLKYIFAHALLDRLWSPAGARKNPQPTAAAESQQPNTATDSQPNGTVGAQPAADPYATMLDRLPASAGDGGDLVQRATDLVSRICAKAAAANRLARKGSQVEGQRRRSGPVDQSGAAGRRHRPRRRACPLVATAGQPGPPRFGEGHASPEALDAARERADQHVAARGGVA